MLYSLVNRHERQSAIINVAVTGSWASAMGSQRPGYRSQIDAVAFELVRREKKLPQAR